MQTILDIFTDDPAFQTILKTIRETPNSVELIQKLLIATSKNEKIRTTFDVPLLLNYIKASVTSTDKKFFMQQLYK